MQIAYPENYEAPTVDEPADITREQVKTQIETYINDNGPMPYCLVIDWAEGRLFELGYYGIKNMRKRLRVIIDEIQNEWYPPEAEEE